MYKNICCCAIKLFKDRLPLFMFFPDSKNSWGQHGAHLGPVGPRWAPFWPHVRIRIYITQILSIIFLPNDNYSEIWFYTKCFLLSYPIDAVLILSYVCVLCVLCAVCVVCVCPQKIAEYFIRVFYRDVFFFKFRWILFIPCCLSGSNQVKHKRRWYIDYSCGKKCKMGWILIQKACDTDHQICHLLPMVTLRVIRT